MSATPPPPPPPSSSSSPTGQPYGRPSAGPYRGAGQQQHVRTSPQQRPPTTQSSPTFNRFFTRGAGASAPSSSPSGGGSGGGGGAPANASAAFGSLRGSPGNAGTRSHVDPSARGIGPTCTPPATSTTTSEPLPPTTGAPVPPAVSAELLQSLALAVHESLSAYLYPDAVELAQRLFNLDGSFSNLHLLAHAHLLSGSTGTAYRLLHHHFPFFELHVTRPRTASATHSGSSTMLGSSSISGGGGGDGGNADGGVGGTQLPLDARRTWSTTTTTTTTAGRSATSSTFNITGVEHSINFSYERVDLKAQWDCQYLLGVCCYRTQHYEDGVKVLSQLLYVKQQLDGAVASLRRQQQQQQASTNAASSEGADWKASVERQLRAYTFVTDAKQSQLLYWLGLCEKQRQRQAIAADYLRKSFTLYSTRLDAFQEYVRLGWPSEEVVQDLLTVKEPLAEEEDEEDEEEEKAREREGNSSRGVEVSYNHQQQQQRPPLRRARESTAHAAAAAAFAEGLEDEEQHHRARHNLARPRNPAGEKAVSLHGPSLTLAQRRCLERHLQPFLRAVFLTTTYRCPEAVEAVRSVLLQQPTSSVPATPAGPPAASAESPWLLRQLALAQFHNGDVAESAETFERLLRAAPWDLTSTALIFYSTALWHLKSESALGSLAQRLTDAEPYSPTTFCVVANAYSLIKDPRDALVMLKRAVQVAPTLAYAHALYGYELLGQDNKAEAENAFKTALAVDHTLYIAYAGLGERFIREEQVGKARDYYKEAVKINPTPAIMNRFALTYHRQEKSETHLKCALRLYTESLQRHPNNTTARRQRTDVLLRLDRPKEALEELKALLVQCPGEAAVYMTLAECMVCLRRPQEALQHYQTAMHLDPRRESYVQGCIDRLVAARML